MKNYLTALMVVTIAVGCSNNNETKQNSDTAMKVSSSTQSYIKARMENHDIAVKANANEPQTIAMLDTLQKKAQEGDAESCYKLAMIFKESGSHDQNDGYYPAAALFKKAADLGYADAQVELAIAYFNGRGIDNDKAEAFYYALLANEKGNERAKYILAAMELSLGRREYEQGMAKARDWLKAQESVSNK